MMRSKVLGDTRYTQSRNDLGTCIPAVCYLSRSTSDITSQSKRRCRKSSQERQESYMEGISCEPSSVNTTDGQSIERDQRAKYAQAADSTLRSHS